jgi:DNA-binding GntR family transcriptional regulator
MSRTVELPDAVYAALEEAARASGATAADWIAAHLLEIGKANGASPSAREDWLDRDFLKTYAKEADDSVSLEDVRRAMAKIPGRLADDIRAERDEH